MKKTNLKNLIKIIKICTLCFLIAVLPSCTKYEPETGDGRLKVLGVMFYQYDFARQICRDRADVAMLTKPGAEIHGYEPSLSDIVAIQNADVLILGGGKSDVWVERILSSIDCSDKVIVRLLQDSLVKLYKEEHVSQGHSHSSDENGHNHSVGDMAYDEHIWTSPKNAINIAEVICRALCDADLKNSDYYKQNYKTYKKELAALDAELEALAENSENKLIAVADRFPFLYLAKDYGFEYMSAFSGCSPETDAGPSVIADMIDEIKRHKLNSIFYIELSNQKMADAIAEHTRVQKRLLHSCQNVSRKEFEAKLGYVDIMKNNIRYIGEAIS